MKPYTLLTPIVVIGSAIAPILSISVPAQSQPSLATKIAFVQHIDRVTTHDSPNLTQPTVKISQVENEVIDFGLRQVGQANPAQKSFKIEVRLPLGHDKFVVTPANPFLLNTHNGIVDASRRGEVDVSLNSIGLALGNHEKTITILSDRKLIIKRVLLKVKVIQPPTTPSNPNGPTQP